MLLKLAVVPLKQACQAVVLPNNDSVTVSTLKIGDKLLFDSIFEAIGAYKYPTLSYMKEYESMNKILEILSYKSAKCPHPL